MYHRIIPRLDIKGPNLVKGIHLEGLRVLGNPYDFAELYYKEGADELIYQDVVASLYERNSLTQFVEETAEKIFIPLTVGGGIRNLNDIDKLLKAGADKISINTAAIKRPDFIREASEKFGSSTIVISIEVILQDDGNYELFIDNGRESTGLFLSEWLNKVQEFGAGEIVVTSVDRDGTMKGIDLKLVKKVISQVDIPFVYHGGISSIRDSNIFMDGNISGIAVASSFHYYYLNDKKLIYKDRGEGNTSFLNSSFSKKKKGFSIKDLKNYMITKDINVRNS